MIDTWNPAELNNAVKSGAGGGGAVLPDITPSDYGSYLAVDELGEWGLDQPKQLLDYKATEQNTGLKWIDGSEIYVKSFTGVAGTSVTPIDTDIDYTPIRCDGYIKAISGLGVSIGGIASATTWTFAVHVDVSNNLNVMTGTDTNGGTYYVTVYYIKETTKKGGKKK